MKIWMDQKGKKYAKELAESEHDVEIKFPHADLVEVLSHPNAGHRGDDEIAFALEAYRNPDAYIHAVAPVVPEVTDQAELPL